MKLGVFTVLFRDKSFTDMLDYVKEAGLSAVEIGTGCYSSGCIVHLMSS